MATKRKGIRHEGRGVEALLILLKHVTAHARWVFALLLVVWGLSGIRTVGPNERALVLRMGRVLPEVREPGLFVGMPEPFDRLVRFETGKEFSVELNAWRPTGDKISDPDVQVELSDEELNAAIRESRNGGAAEAVYERPEGMTLDPVVDGYSLTSDFNVIQGGFVLRYRIDDPFRFATTGDDVEKLLGELAYRALALQVAERPIDRSLTEDRRDLAAVATKEVAEMVEGLGIGVKVSGIDVVALGPPSQVMAAFEDLSNARQFAKTMFENARQYRDETLEKSRGEGESIVYRAEGYAAGLVGEAKGEAAAFLSMLAQYQRSPELVSRRLLGETLDTVYGTAYSRSLVPVDGAAPSLMIKPAPEFSR